MSQKLVKYGYKLPHGRSIRDMIWQELDDCMDWLMTMKPEPEPWWLERQPDGENIGDFRRQWQEYGKHQGKAEELAFVIALFEDPIHPDMDSVRAAAVDRYKERQELLEFKTLEEVVHHASETVILEAYDAGQASEGNG